MLFALELVDMIQQVLRKVLAFTELLAAAFLLLDVLKLDGSLLEEVFQE